MQKKDALWLIIAAIIVPSIVIAVINNAALFQWLGWQDKVPSPYLLSVSGEAQTQTQEQSPPSVSIPMVTPPSIEHALPLDKPQLTANQLSPEVQELLAQIEHSVAEIAKLPRAERQAAEPLLQELEQLKTELKQADLEGQRLQQDVQAKTQASETLNQQIEAIRQHLQ